MTAIFFCSVAGEFHSRLFISKSKKYALFECKKKKLGESAVAQLIFSHAFHSCCRFYESLVKHFC